jgi:hypothetical protein
VPKNGWWRVGLILISDTIDKTGKSGRSFDWDDPADVTNDAAV